jgi:hypothetical protein
MWVLKFISTYYYIAGPWSQPVLMDKTTLLGPFISSFRDALRGLQILFICPKMCTSRSAWQRSNQTHGVALCPFCPLFRIVTNTQWVEILRQKQQRLSNNFNFKAQHLNILTPNMTLIKTTLYFSECLKDRLKRHHTLLSYNCLDIITITIGSHFYSYTLHSLQNTHHFILVYHYPLA